jgi:hypothetical protein
VVFLDADVIVGPDFLREHVKAHQRGNGQTAAIGYVHAYALAARDRTPEVVRPPPIDDVLRELPRLVQADPKRWMDGRESNYRIWPDLVGCPVPWFFFWSCNVSVPRALALEVGGFDESFKHWGFEDIELGYRLWRRGVRFALCRGAWGFHYPHPTGGDGRLLDNLRQFLAMHPEAYPELGCFSIVRLGASGAARVRWEFMELVRAPPPLSVPTDGAYRGALAEARGDRCAPVAWFGGLPTGGAQDLQPDLVSRPFATMSSDGRAGLAGLALPYGDGSLGAVVLHDYWRHLSDAALRFVCEEALRVAETCVLVAEAGPALSRRITASQAASRPGWICHTLEVEGARLEVLRSGERS